MAKINNRISNEIDANMTHDDDEISASSNDTGTSASRATDIENQKCKSKSKADEENQKEVLSQKETNRVFRLRFVVFVVLLLATLAVSTVVYRVTTKSEHNEFQTQYEGAAKHISRAFTAIAQYKIGGISALAVAMTAHALDHNTTWPFVTLSSFQERAATARGLSNSLFVAVSPHVGEEDRAEWEKYNVGSGSSWIEQGFEYQERLNLNQYLQSPKPGDDEERMLQNQTEYPIFYTDENNNRIVDPGPGPYMPIWQTSPVLRGNLINFNLYRNPGFSDGATKAWNTHTAVIGRMDYAPPGNSTSANGATSFYATIMSVASKTNAYYEGDIMSTVFIPIFNNFTASRHPSAILFTVIRWASFFENIFPKNIRGAVIVLENSCGGSFTYRVDGPSVNIVGPGDLHDRGYDQFKHSATFNGLTKIADGTQAGIPLNQDACYYNLNVYPSKVFEDDFKSSTPIVITLSVAIVFAFTALMFLFYDRLVERRQQILLKKAMQSTAIVFSLFPKNVRDRLLQQSEPVKENLLKGPNQRLKSYLSGNQSEGIDNKDPIADLFPNATVLFADIAGFTAWSSTREPTQVFILLQTVYQAFDLLANQRKVFKVETIGDSYVAVTGLPEPQERHAVIMARFAGDCMKRMEELTKDLEVALGPDTGDLAMRMGMHSGPVTAGVLRGERSRFQLFGDTVNTAARMENTGSAHKIQISQATADLLFACGKDYWVTPRNDAVEAKGKGVMKTFWLYPMGKKTSSDNGSSGKGAPREPEYPIPVPVAGRFKDPEQAAKQQRLVDWMVELLQEHLRLILAKREATGMAVTTGNMKYFHQKGGTALDEVSDVLHIPEFNPQVFARMKEIKSIKLDPEVISQMKEFVTTMANTYHDNPFHNFEHACHVTLAVNKFLRRIVTPDVNVTGKDSEAALQLHDYTHGINSDPLSHFAIVFAALIHDAGHRGISNAQLIKEDEKMAVMYKSKSVAEQHSLDLAWDTLMEDKYDLLRKCIFGNQAEVRRFRQTIVNVVMATDIFDKELNDGRKLRWNKAFGPNADKIAHNMLHDLRATIVIEHLIQASDVSHTMQHWHIYRRWNKQLFTEMYLAYRAGRMGMDPSSFWFRGEIGFFENYVIPLAKKLKECNVFGVSSDECLNYALKNRVEWEERGKEMVELMVQEMSAKIAIEEKKSGRSFKELVDDAEKRTGRQSFAVLPDVDSENEDEE